jgi:hypothetical protein
MQAAVLPSVEELDAIIPKYFLMFIPCDVLVAILLGQKAGPQTSNCCWRLYWTWNSWCHDEYVCNIVAKRDIQ